ncbi:MAG: peptide deformylase [Firmicutes bacterium]|nr:peptide deformylase [Bacillota bacterium]
MSKRAVRKLEDPVLRKKAKNVEKIDPLLLHTMEDMLETMYESIGVGLAGPQIGISKRTVVIDIGEGPVKLINPKIISKEGSQIGLEGCLSIPGIYGDVDRAEKVTLKAQNEKGEIIKIEAEGFMARVIQHELDHLDGVLFIDKATNIRKAEEIEETESQDSEQPKSVI